MSSPAMAACSDLIVFGDSLGDVGNAHALRGDAAFACPPHWRGRRCDGPLWVEILAETLGLPPLRHSLAGGSDHAFGGARSGEGLSPKGMPNLLRQVDDCLAAGLRIGADGPDHADAQAEPLVVLRAGANDYLDTPPTPAVGAAVNRHLLAAVERLADAGLRRFLVPSELPWGFSPIELPGLGPAERRGLNALIAAQNAGLRPALTALAAARGLIVVQPDFHGLFLAVLADPAAHGFTQTGRPVLEGDARVAGDAAGFLWWDSWAHLTSAFHRLLAAEAQRQLARGAL